MITQEDWMNLRALKPLKDAGYSYAALAAEAGCDWRTAKKYLENGRAALGYGPRPPRGKLIDPFTRVIDEWLRADIKIKATTIHERLASFRRRTLRCGQAGGHAGVGANPTF
ncbi:MAG: hypothetical protein GEU78_18175 [Actinobacteria bacterium]|nr:hypothetical protein [Actinomycetota bacterium]